MVMVTDDTACIKKVNFPTRRERDQVIIGEISRNCDDRVSRWTKFAGVSY